MFEFKMHNEKSAWSLKIPYSIDVSTNVIAFILGPFFFFFLRGKKKKKKIYSLSAGKEDV